jgi:imidazole glycerol-phosphate synthase subunit HisF
MKEVRVIPVLLIKNGGLVKSVKFKDHRYVGDPINAVRIFNEKEVDELAILDISASAANREPDYVKIEEIASEAFMPVSYGGGITNIEQVAKLFYLGVEKMVINKVAHTNPALIQSIASVYGQQSVVVSIDVKKNFWGKYKVYTDNGKKDTGIDPVSFARQCAVNGAGEILLNSIDKDGTYAGYDTELTEKVSSSVHIPVIVCGGAGTLAHFRKASDCGASAVAAGSMFVFQRPHNAVLISYPSRTELSKTFS